MYDKKYIKIKLDSDDKLPLNKTIEIPVMVIVARAISFMKITNIINKFSQMNVSIKNKTNVIL